MTAAVRLVEQGGTTAVSVIDLAEAADVSRQMLYLHFGDRDALLVAAAADLVERDLLAEVGDPDAAQRGRILAVARHFARHRRFYRPMLTGACAQPLSAAFAKLFGSLITDAGLREVFGDLDDATARDVITLISHGVGAIVHDWVVNGADPLVPEELADRLQGLIALLVRRRRGRAETTGAAAPGASAAPVT
jgi:AcrR family transcriptional regulator